MERMYGNRVQGISEGEDRLIAVVRMEIEDDVLNLMNYLH